MKKQEKRKGLRVYDSLWQYDNPISPQQDNRRTQRIGYLTQHSPITKSSHGRRTDPVSETIDKFKRGVPHKEHKEAVKRRTASKMVSANLRPHYFSKAAVERRRKQGRMG